MSLLSNEKNYQKSVLALGAILVLVPMIVSLFRGEIYCDSAYYICHAQLLSHGMVPYEDFHFGYTPLWLYIAAALKILFRIPDGSFVFYLALHYLFMIGNAFLLYKISRLWNVGESVALLGAFLYLTWSHWLQGNELLLEAPSIFFGLWSIQLLLVTKGKHWALYVIAGVVCSCSFLCKQFGLGFIALNILLLITINHARWKDVLSFLVGYSLLIVLCFVIWKGHFLSLIFSGYGTKTAIEAGCEITIGERLLTIIRNIGFFVLRVCPVAVLSLLYIFKTYRQNRYVFWEIVFCYCGIIGFGLQFYFALGFHYYLYLEPFGILLTLLVLSVEDKPFIDRIKWAIVIWTIVFSLYKTYKCRVYNWYLTQNKNIRDEQILTAKEISSIVPPNSCIWVTGGEQYIYLLTGSLPPNLSTIGFSFGPLGINEEKSLKQARDATFVIASSNEQFLYADKLLGYLKQYQSYPINDTTFLIYDKRAQIK